MGMRNRQRGLTFISIMVIIAVIAFLAMMVLKLFPIYMEDFSVSSSVNGLSQEAGKGPQELRTALMRRLSINNVDNVSAEDVVIERDGNGYRVTVDYEVRVAFIRNIDFVVSFNHSVEVPSS